MRSLNVIGLTDEIVDLNQDTVEEMRRLSNVVQALENVLIQCADHEPFSHIREFAQQALNFSRQQMHWKIHQQTLE